MRSANAGLARSAGAAGAATLASRLLGLVRDQVLAAMFGAGNAMDAFIVAFRIPNLARDLVAEGAMSAAFVPTFTRHLTEHGKHDAWRLANHVLNALLLITGTVVVVGIVFAGPLVTLYAGEYAQVPGKLELTIRLTRVVLPFLTLAALSAAMMGMLNSLHHYFLPALAPATFNVAMIVCIVVLAPLLPAVGQPAIMAVAAGAIVGGVAQTAVQWVPLRREGFRYRPLLDRRDPGLARVLVLMGPGTIGLAATQVNLFINTLLATGEGTGAASWLTYAFRLMYLPLGLFGVSIATVVLPAAARHAAAGDRAAIRGTLARGLGLMLALNVPATVGLTVLAVPIVRLLFERGQFLPQDTAATASALQLYAIGLVGYSAARIASPIFYAIGHHRVPVLVSAASIGVNIVASVVLVQLFGFRGLALGTSIAALVHGVLLLSLLRRRLDGLEGRRLALTFAKVLVASTAMALAVLAAEFATPRVAETSSVLGQTAQVTAAIIAGLVVLIAAAKILRIHEFEEAMDAAVAWARKLLGS